MSTDLTDSIEVPAASFVGASWARAPHRWALGRLLRYGLGGFRLAFYTVLPYTACFVARDAAAGLLSEMKADEALYLETETLVTMNSRDRTAENASIGSV